MDMSMSIPHELQKGPGGKKQIFKERRKEGDIIHVTWKGKKESGDGRIKVVEVQG